MRSFVKSSTFRLAVSYLAIIMTLSIAFSTVFYTTSAHELDKKPDPDYYHGSYAVPDHELDEWLRDRAETGRGSLAMNLVFLNLVALIFGGAFSYFLARKTLQPIEAAMEMQDRFIADASHELRTPLTSLLLNNEVALRKKALTAEGAKKAIEQNIHDLEQLRSLSNNLLDLAAREKSEIVKKPIPITSAVGAAVDQVAPMAEAKNIKLRASVGSQVATTNQLLLTKLLVILCDNAIKYSDAKKFVHITSEATDKRVVIHVSDEGYGMEKADADRIFDRFYRADRSRSSTTGHGLGLSIAAKIAHDLNGSISVKSTPGKGSVFSISLPV
jgi:two-component system sensor histidine kinase CiaH